MAKRATKKKDDAVEEPVESQVNDVIEPEAPDTAPNEESLPEAAAAAEPEAPKMTPEEIAAAVEKADFSIQEKPEKKDEVPPALMFDADTKVTPALIMKKQEELEAKRKQDAATENKGPRVEKRKNGRRIIRHN